MRPLADSPRRRLLGSAVLLCAGAVALVPLAALPSMPRSQPRSRTAATLELARMPLARTAPEIRLKRDPFAADPPPATPAPAGDSPENATLQALVTGNAPYALVSIGGSVRVVSAGMPLLGSRVRGIDAAGLHLENGATLHFESAHP